MKKVYFLIMVVSVALLCSAAVFAADLESVSDQERLSVIAPPQVDCFENGTCSRNSYCAKNPGDCDGIGECEVRSQVCAEIYSPVCGCDGRTYGNDCEAAAAGVNIEYFGECQTTVAFRLNEVFELAYQEKATNLQNNISIEFVTVVTDNRCPLEATCLTARNAEVVFTLYIGDAVQSFILNTGIEPKSVTISGYEIQLLDLSPLPSAYQPTDQNSYVAFVQISRSPFDFDCNENADCSRNEYCAKDIGNCDGSGVCVERTDMVTMEYDPVCGCDGVTYPNKSSAAAAGVNVSQKGQCRPVAVPYNE